MGRTVPLPASLGSAAFARTRLDQGFDLYDDHLTAEWENFMGERVTRKRDLFFDETSQDLRQGLYRKHFGDHFVGEGYLHDGDAAKGTKVLRFRPDVPKSGPYEIRLAYSPFGNRASNRSSWRPT